MKKIFSLLILVSIALTVCVPFMGADYAADADIMVDYNDEYKHWIHQQDVVSGTASATQYAEKIAEAMEKLGLVTLGIDGSYLQSFSVYDALGEEKTAVNVVGKLQASISTKDTVIIGMTYDRVEANAFDALVSNVTSAATANGENRSDIFGFLTIMDLYSAKALPVNVIFAAFSTDDTEGLGSHDFIERMSAEERSHVMAYVHLDSFSGGENLYIYCDEKPNDLSRSLYKQLSDSMSLEKVPSNTRTMVDQLTTGFPYTNFALRGTTAAFYAEGFHVACVLSGNWRTGKRATDANSFSIDEATMQKIINSATLFGNAIIGADSLAAMSTTGDNELRQGLLTDFEKLRRGRQIVMAVILAVFVLVGVLLYKLKQKAPLADDTSTAEAPKNFDEDDLFTFGDDNHDTNTKSAGDTPKTPRKPSGGDDDIFDGF